MTVYFVKSQALDLVKIGYTNDLNTRMSQLRAESADMLEIIRAIPGRLDAEFWLHEYFRHMRLRGEWFVPHPEMMTVLPPAALMVNAPTAAADLQERNRLHEEIARLRAENAALSHDNTVLYDGWTKECNR